jgi:hypothetical protein
MFLDGRVPAMLAAAPEWLRELAGSRCHYIELLGWPVEMEIGERRIVVAVGNALHTITMPASLASQVLCELQICMLAGPVVEGPNTDWTFFTAPPETADPLVPDDLRPMGVRSACPGSRVVLPPNQEGHDHDRWVVQPQSHPVLPPWSAVIATARRVTARLQAEHAPIGETVGG